jgi:hypothetical protein
MSQAMIDVLSERLRQRDKEGHSDAHDDRHGDGSLAMAGACYASLAAASAQTGNNVKGAKYRRSPLSMRWPWDRKYWKPKDPRRDLVRAAALIIAEIERIDRHNSQGKAR